MIVKKKLRNRNWIHICFFHTIISHQKNIDNAIISTKKDDDFTKEKHYEYMKQAINNIQKRNVEALIDKIFKTK